MPEISLLIQIESVCDQFEAALRQGASPRIEDFLTGWQGEARDTLLKHLLELEIECLASTSETLPVAGYRRRFADQIHVVERLVGGSKELLEILDRLGELGLVPAGERLLLKGELEAGDSSLTIDSLCRRLTSRQHLTDYQAQSIGRGELERLALGNYIILDRIGQGGMGVVYRARQHGLNREVALKTILARDTAGSEEIRRFRQEAESAARLHHPGIVAVYDFGEAAGVHFFAMEYVDGVSLSARLAEAALAPQAAAQLMQQLAEAVAYAHLQGVIHRDLKPANILLQRDGTPRITDFGLAKLVDRESQTVTGDVLGTPSYMPPEQAIGKAGAVGEAADIYSLGAILYSCLCGHPPFKAETVMATLKLVVEQPPVPPRQFNQQLPVDLETICLKCLEKDPEQRYRSAANLAKELERFLRGEPISARRVSRVERLRRWCRRNPLVAGLTGLAAMLLVAGTIISSYFAVLASRRAARAEEGTRIAVETLESVVFQMQEKLRSIPAAREVRRDILQQALREIEKLSDLQGSSDRTDLGTGVVLSRFASIIMDVGSDDALGSLETAEKNLQRACEIFARCQAADPGNPRIDTEWAFALLKAGDLAVTMRKLDRAKECTQAAMARYRELAAKEPDSTLWQKHLSHSLSVAGDISMMTGAPSDALEEFREGKEIGRRLLNLEPHNPDFHEALIVSLEKEADAHLRLGDAATARRLYAENLQLNQDYLAEDPADSIRMYSLSFCYERLAEFEVGQGRPAEGADYYEREIEVLIQTIEADPKNVKLQQEIGMPLGKLLGLYHQLERTDEAAAIQNRVQGALARVKQP